MAKSETRENWEINLVEETVSAVELTETEDVKPETIGVMLDTGAAAPGTTPAGELQKVPLKSATDSEEALAIQKAKIVSMVTIVVCLSLGTAAIVVGIMDMALALFGLGIEILLDAQSSVVVLWRFKDGKERFYATDSQALKFKMDRDARREAKGARLTALAFTCVAAVLTAFAVVKLVTYNKYDANNHRHELRASLFEMYYSWPTGIIFLILAWIKWTLGDQLDSDVLRLDSLSSFVGAFLALVVGVAGLLENKDGAWMADPVAALIIATILLFTGLRTWYDTTHWTTKHQHQVDVGPGVSTQGDASTI